MCLAWGPCHVPLKLMGSSLDGIDADVVEVSFLSGCRSSDLNASVWPLSPPGLRLGSEQAGRGPRFCDAGGRWGQKCWAAREEGGGNCPEDQRPRVQPQLPDRRLQRRPGRETHKETCVQAIRPHLRACDARLSADTPALVGALGREDTRGPQHA